MTKLLVSKVLWGIIALLGVIATPKSGASQDAEDKTRNEAIEYLYRRAKILHDENDAVRWVMFSGNVTDRVLDALKHFPEMKTLIVSGRDTDGSFLANARSFSKLESLGLAGCAKFKPENLVYLKHLENLNDLRLSNAKKHARLQNTREFDEGMVHLRPLKRLESLDIDRLKIGNAGLSHVGELKSLVELRMEKTRITNMGLIRLNKLSKLQTLFVDENNISDEGIVHLSKLPSLQELFVNRTKVTGIGFKSDGFDELWCLSACNCPVDDRSIAGIAALPKLKRLYISGTKISDKALVHIKKMKLLEELDVTDTQLTKTLFAN